MLDVKPVDRILFLDIETTSRKEKFVELTEDQQTLFLKTFRNKGGKEAEAGDESARETLYSDKAPIFAADWGKIICISVGKLIAKPDGKGYNMRISSFANPDEKTLLNLFVTKLGAEYFTNTSMSHKDSFAICAHNGEVFDFPVITKRLIINGIKPPKAFDYEHLKPWERSYFIDTKKAWSLGVFDSNTSLATLCDVFNVPSSKDDIDGSEVKGVFYGEPNGLQRIKTYCEKDVLALARVYLKMKCMNDEIEREVVAKAVPKETVTQ
jgi:3'-5' exonuclease